MKKIVFALQVFSLLIALPLYVVIEMNHATAAPAENSKLTQVIENEQNISVTYFQLQSGKLKI